MYIIWQLWLGTLLSHGGAVGEVGAAEPAHLWTAAARADRALALLGVEDQQLLRRLSST